MTDPEPKPQTSLVYESAKGLVVCAAAAALISWLGPYYFITCERTEDGLQVHARQMLIGLIPAGQQEYSGVGAVGTEQHGAGRGATQHLQLSGTDVFDFRADHAPFSIKLLEELLEAPAGERLFFSDGIIFWGLYIPVMVFLFGFVAVVIALDHHESGPLANLPDATEFAIGWYLGVGAAGWLFVYLTDVVRAPLWAWCLLVLVSMAGGIINVVRVRLKGNAPAPSQMELPPEEQSN